MRDRLVATLDLGSSKTFAVIAEGTGNAREPGAKILGVGFARTTGVKRGVVRDIEETTRSITQAMRDAERMAGLEIPTVYCGIAGDHVQTRISTGLASVASEEITRSDIERVDDVAKAISLGDDYELLHYIPQEYKVDNQGGINDPVGMTGLRLEVEMCLVAVQNKAAQNLRKSVERAGYKVTELVLEPLAASMATVTADEKEIGCALIDLGSGSTSVAVFHDGKMRHLSSIPFGGANVTSDIVQGLGVTQSDAERLKEKSGCAYTPLVDLDEVIEIPGTAGQGPRQVKRELLAHIIHQRMDEILGLVADRIEEAGYAGRLAAGAILTGGGAQLSGIVELTREVFAMPVREGIPGEGIVGIVDHVQAPRFAVPVGLALYATRQVVGGRMDGGQAVDRLFGPVKRWLQDFF
ncbi:MAG: cell division protein FtsA [Gemmatimonadota bacterium]|nr:MAG: cell division protein FtsA [Gemmatimonadota bacterium]